jgi:dihydrofolate reductase / thymidylate synthase
MRDFSCIVAATADGFGIGANGKLPWSLSGDMAFFKKQTSSTKFSSNKDGTTSGEGEVKSEPIQNAVIMGRKTWESIPTKFRPLAGRLNVVLSKNANLREDLKIPDDIIVTDSLENALTLLETPEMVERVESVYVIGGGSVYAEAVKSTFCNKIYLTSIESKFEGIDTFFPVIPANMYQMAYYSEAKEEKEITYRFTRYDRLSQTFLSGVPESSEGNAEEQQYLDAVKDIMENGVIRGDRTGTGTISKFGVQMRYSLRDNSFPLLTTKRVFWRGVAEELLWFVKGCTNANELMEKDIHIWDGNGSREFLDSRGLQHREEGDLGPVYGFQWRHFGAEYSDMHADYTGKGVDQLKNCVETIMKNPEDRRIIFSAWNPADLDKMALPPCHMFCQFYVANGELSLQMYQRSADMGLGVPFNIASYSLLLVMVAQVCGLQPGEFVHTIGDAHIYLNHVDALKEQVKRRPRTFPKIEINPDINDIDGFNFSDFKIVGYSPDKPIKMKMAV